MSGSGWWFYPAWAGVGGAIAAGIVIVSLAPPAVLPGAASVNDKLAHLFAYAALAGWNAQILDLRRHGWLAAACVALGLGLELAQGLTAERTPELLDGAANVLGVVMGLLVSRSWLAGRVMRLDRWIGRRLIPRRSR